ncbi:MAG: NAD(P)-dependent alcohol dehydrogenase [Chloroflexi bacterium]|nr:NAD(P)-dependent alcohol dehydrogenase [Chloroflexota bacterium]
MKAIICTGYGPPEVLQLADMPKPVPKDNEILIRNHATSVTASDAIVRGFKLRTWSRMGMMMRLVIGVRKPRQPIIGLVVAGEVESVGKNVTKFRPGDQVYGMTGLSFGGYGEYKAMSQNGAVARKPANMTFEQAAAVPYGGLIALHYLNLAKLQRGQNVLVYGASGAIGTAAVQLAKQHFGAHVTGVASASNGALVQALGADAFIDYTAADAAQHLQRYDLVLDAVGEAKTSALKQQARTALTPDGQYISVDDGGPQFNAEILTLLTTLIEAGQFHAVIDTTYPLEQMAAAHHHVDQKHKKGNVIVTLA